MNNIRTTICAAAAIALSACAGTQGGAGNELSGAGATFPLPYYTLSFDNFQKQTGISVSYGGIGSGGGVRSLKDGIVDFAASDAFLTDEEMQHMPPVVHVPTCMGAVVVAYNLPGIDSLRLTGNLIADIFGGKITRWDDPRIAAANESLALPSLDIVPVFRADGSGTTFVFTDYLAKADNDWNVTYGCGKTVNFPIGQAAKGNPGVAGIIGNTQGAIGYIGAEYAFAQKLRYASVANAMGEYVVPTAASISKAAQGAMPTDTRASITNSHADGAYPISCFTWIIVYAEQNYSGRSASQAQSLSKLLSYMLSPEAQSNTAAVGYAPLPANVLQISKANLSNITYNGTPIRQ